MRAAAIAAFVLLAVSAAAQPVDEHELFAQLARCKDLVKWSTTGGSRVAFEGPGSSECNKIAGDYYRAAGGDRTADRAKAKADALQRLQDTAAKKEIPDPLRPKGK